jgi:hypothetical protein
MKKDASWYFTAPWDPVSIRRGDAIGLRAGADYFADKLSPGLNNNTYDARWISILSWCLKWSHVAWQKANGGDLTKRDAQRARYAWLRPMELLWLDRTLASGQTTGQLRGRRSIERWIESERQLPNFAMSPDQFRRYRQIGMYGTYRVLLRTVPELTTNGDGWTPTATAHALANLVNKSLPRNVQLKPGQFENGIKWGHWSNGNEARFWVERGWRTAWETVGGFLPTPANNIHERLPIEERRLIEPVLFGANSIRRVTAEVLASAKQARTHADLCDVLANSNALKKKIEPALLALLPAFTRFADAAMDAMRGLWSEINNDDTKQAPTVKKLARSSGLRLGLERLRAASDSWLRTPGRDAFPHNPVVNQLAESMRDAKTLVAQLGMLARHHHQHGGGRRWFRMQADKIIPCVADTGIATRDYRFRLRPLSRLAAQCGVANMNTALNVISLKEPENEEDDVL